MDIFDASVGIVGAGPAGSALARALACGGATVTLFHDPSRPKHCGGGVPPRAFSRIPWLGGIEAPRAELSRLRLSSPQGGACRIDLPSPLSIFDRAALDASLRDAAARAGAIIVPARVTAIRRERAGWRLAAGGREHRAGFLVGADGVSSLVRRTLSRPFPPGALSLCAGYYLPAPDPGTVSVGFHGPPAAYTWVFPGPGGRASAGIVAPREGRRGEELRRILRDWLEDEFPAFRFDWSRPYAALVPTAGLRPDGVGGKGWALIGDAAGVADPVTREGIFFSVRSAELLASSILAGRPRSYPLLLGVQLLRWHAASLLVRRRLFNARFTGRYIRFLCRRADARREAGDFISGRLGFGRYAGTVLSAWGRGEAAGAG